MSKRKPLTEEQWLSGSTVYSLLRFLQQHHSIAKRVGGKRQLRLLAVGCCRTAWQLITDEDCRRAIEIAERAADGNATRQEVRAAVEAATAIVVAAGDSMRALIMSGANLRSNHPEVIAHSRRQAMAQAAIYTCSTFRGALGLQIVTQSIAVLQIPAASYGDPQAHAKQNAEVDRLHSELIRDVYGNPFRSVEFDPRWLTSTVRDLARTIYDGREFERMPILADALMDAGCDSEEILNHCRNGELHTRGCWLVDTILSKS